MSDRRERAVLGEIYDCLNTMTALAPVNPANIRVVSDASRRMTAAASSLMYAVHCVMAGELAEAREYVGDARRELER